MLRHHDNVKREIEAAATLTLPALAKYYTAISVYVYTTLIDNKQHVHVKRYLLRLDMLEYLGLQVGRSCSVMVTLCISRQIRLYAVGKRVN